MRFDVFENLSEAEAAEFLRCFLAIEADCIKETLRRASLAGCTVDFTLESISSVLPWLARNTTTFRKNPDPKLPEWIRTSESYLRNLFEFADTSKQLILQGAYYLGSSFISHFPSLTWATGDRTFAQANMPVIRGFAEGRELPALLVAENLIARCLSTPDVCSVSVDRAVAFWQSKTKAG